MASVTFIGATRLFSGSTIPAVNQLDLHIEDGEFMVFVGPSGSGKSTALRMLAGLESVDEGQIELDSKDITAIAPKNRDVAMVFQTYALYPHMTVAENMGFALRMAKVPKSERQRRVVDAARLLDLGPLLERLPKQLSGGQRQRVAMGRAIVRQPKVFLMDEPLSNLDAQLRVATRGQIAELQQRLRTTTVYVTHDQVEALTMGTRVAVLRDGMLQQCATPRDLYEDPDNSFVANFVGSPAMSIFSVDLVCGRAVIDGHELDVPQTVQRAFVSGQHSNLDVGIRPESFVLSPTSGIPVLVTAVEELGPDSFLYCRRRRSSVADQLIVRVEGRAGAMLHREIDLDVSPGRALFFDSESGRRLR